MGLWVSPFDGVLQLRERKGMVGWVENVVLRLVGRSV